MSLNNGDVHSTSTLFLKVGFIGGGNMSTAIMKGLLKDGKYPASNIWVSGPHLKNLEVHRQLGANVTTKNGEVLHNCDVVFLGVKPGVLNRAIQGCVDTLTGNVLSKNVLFVSMLLGIDLEKLRQVSLIHLCTSVFGFSEMCFVMEEKKSRKILLSTSFKNKNTQAVNMIPGQMSIVRIMPNTPMAVGAGICLYSPESSVTEQQCALLEKILEPCGICERVSESQIVEIGTLTGCGPAFMFAAIDALADGAVKIGVPRAIAIKMAAQLMIGSGKMVMETGKHPAVLKDEVCSPGGSTISGIAALEAGGMRAALIDAVEAAANRTKEMRNQ